MVPKQGDVGWRVQQRPMENQVNISEQLASEGYEQAGREQRIAASFCLIVGFEPGI
ncbi:MAG: hypothetical protein JO170_03640 [Verrucomicrobia bacterium]|nr:hypothetical protein [Verrucomicrobiota bacterium]